MSRWPVARLGDVVELAYGKSLPAKARQSGAIPVYGSNGIAGYHNEALVPCSTIIVGRKGSAGAIRFVEGPSYPIDTTFFVRQRDPRRSDLRYLALILEHLNLDRLAITTGVPGLNRDDAYREVIPFPPINEQRRIVDLLDRAAGIRRLREQALAKARETIPALFLSMFGDPATNPKGWPSVTLGEVIESGPQNGLYRPASDYGEGVRILRIDSFDEGAITDVASLKRLRVNADTVARYGLAPGDIVVNRVNSPPQLGKSALVPNLDEPVVFESNMMRLRLDSCRLRPDVAAVMLQLPSVRRQLTRNAKHAINQSSINQGDVKAVWFPLPSLHLQHCFAARLASLRSIVARQERALAAARDLERSLMGQLLG